MRAGMTRVAAYSSKLLLERAALAAVEGQHGLVDGHAGEGLVDDGARDARGLRVARHGGQESVEIAAALRGRGGRGEKERDKQGQE